MDRWDKKILYQLDLDGRISFSKIAKKVGKSKSFVKYRVENLQRKNILLDFVTIIDTSKLGFQTYDIYLQIIEDKSVEDEICDFLKLIPEINCIQKIIGKYQLYISLFVKYFGDLENFFINFLEKYHKVISSYEILMIYKAYSPAHNYLFGNEMKKINHSKALLCSRPIELSKKEIEIL
ncbi:MAG: Lrp/AsnC family transcriptional regulator, partial [Nanoarchaeota archaeon]|nr:Lrp/AsnC family transcriptional regulator [Nanoarchaeota archaeon]